jgi:F0F1-type ATP synthase assembly protein I
MDDYFQTEPVFLIIMTFLGAIAGMVTLIRTALKKKKVK